MNTETLESFPTLRWLLRAFVPMLTAVLVAVGLASCSHLDPLDPQAAAQPAPEPVVEEKPKPEPIAPPPPSRLYEWHGSDEYLTRIVVDIDEQKARFYSGDEQVGWTTIASGLHKYPTPTGSFSVTEKVQNKRSNLYGRIYNKNGKLVKSNAKMGVHRIPSGGYFKGAPMPYFMRLTNDGIGLHAGPIPRPGNRASHGCIRMPKKFAPILYRHVSIGTPVTIEGTGPSYASYLSKQRRARPKARSAVVAATPPARTPDSDSAPVTPVAPTVADGTLMADDTQTAQPIDHTATHAIDQPTATSETATVSPQPDETPTASPVAAATAIPDAVDVAGDTVSRGGSVASGSTESASPTEASILPSPVPETPVSTPSIRAPDTSPVATTATAPAAGESIDTSDGGLVDRSTVPPAAAPPATVVPADSEKASRSPPDSVPVPAPVPPVVSAADAPEPTAVPSSPPEASVPTPASTASNR